ncbi:uncharacterized protein UV8b_05481 [Ustilaginoidea virens]|uniref:TeaA receptor TeaR n=1 Tax=Ustilaginoidea virens TaxID=1159556 RepID=A0A063C338_USTVR|nr:uncharacterized protein UV8b_05481 [Ustilaginoidea virens]QUC21238.1 hypothetical protein UV8b_05481 [Ustilaginoidea virens]GAO17219.1 hypothetical protein UVI_02057430 [Ustilaginoidea virens]
MTAVSAAPPRNLASKMPSSGHVDDERDSGPRSENTTQGNNGAPRFDEAIRRPSDPESVNTSSSSYSQDTSHYEMAVRKRDSADILSNSKCGKPGEEHASRSSMVPVESRLGDSDASDSAIHPRSQTVDECQGHIQPKPDLQYSVEDSKWIHRDKLAKIESEELEAAGFILPKLRTSSKQRRTRGGQQSIDYDQCPSRCHSAVGERRDEASPTPCWDLRTAEEIAKEEASAYFAAQDTRGSTRIPVAKTSPSPIPLDYLERSSPSVRRLDPPEGDTIAHTRSRPQSASTSAKDVEAGDSGTHLANGKRPAATDTSPRKNTPRKVSAGSRSSVVMGRPKARFGPSREATVSRPVTRHGEPVAAGYRPEGDPPWIIDSYKPDPRLPPDQQLLPTVAKRLRQEQWEKEGKFGDAYDREFRPLNNHEFLQPQDREPGPREEKQEEGKGGDEEEEEQARQVQDGGEEEARKSGEWPLKSDMVKSPKPSSYSTMPKISDKPAISPKTSSKTAPSAPISSSQDTQPAAAAPAEVTKNKAGCGCCAVM